MLPEPGAKRQELALPHRLASWLRRARSSSSPSATHLRSALLLHLPFSFAPPVLHCFSCRPLLSPPPLSHILLHICSLPPSRHLHVLLPAPSIMHFRKIPLSAFNFCFPSTNLPACFGRVWTSLPHQASSLHAQTPRRDTLASTNSPDSQMPLPRHLRALPSFLNASISMLNTPPHL